MPDSPTHTQPLTANFTLVDSSYDPDYVDVQCRRLLGGVYYSNTSGSDAKKVLRYMKDRGINHGVFEYGKGYRCAAIVQMVAERIQIIGQSDDPATAISLVGLKLSELAGV